MVAEQPVTGLRERVQPYRIDGVMCESCRTWGTLEEARDGGWWTVDGLLYCSVCTEREFNSVTTS